MSRYSSERLDAVGFGSLNLDEFWEVPPGFLAEHDLESGREYVRNQDWFQSIYPLLAEKGLKKACDPGGSAANTIAALASMGFRTGFYGAVGAEDFDALRLEQLGRPQDMMIERVDAPSGRCLALISREDDGRDRCLVILPNANDMAGAEGLIPDRLERAAWLHMTSFVSDGPLRAQIELAEALPETTRLSFDPGAIYASRGLAALEPIVRRTEVLFCTEDELSAITGRPEEERSLELLFSRGVETVVVKHGSRGLSAHRSGETVFQPAIPPRVLRDRTGAGDVAAAGFLAGMLMGADLCGCVKLAAAAASRSLEGYGRSSYPDRSFLRSALDDRDPFNDYRHDRE